MVELPHGTVTFLFTDIAGATALWERDRAAMQEAVARQLAILNSLIAAHHGVLYKTIGDGTQAAFTSAEDALRAAVAAQRALLAEVWPDPPGPLRVRMALHAGEATPDARGDYLAAPLNRLARLLAAAHGGQILLSQTVQQLIRGALPAGATVRDLGEHRLRDLLEPERVFQLVHPELPADFPPLQSLATQPSTLPRQPTPFLGREHEVGEISALLHQPEVQLLTLTGAGGTGKTRLALQAAAEVADTFADGVFFVPLAALADPGMVPAAITMALGVREEGGQPLLERLAAHLARKHLLLVMDNWEHLLEGAAVLGDLLQAAPGLTALATSRAPLHLQAEREYPVPPLALPQREPPPTLEQLSQYGAVRLFVTRAQAVKPDFAIDNTNAPAVAEICRRLDGLPLAIELAAARVKLLAPDAMLRRLEQGLAILTGGGRDLPARQRTLRDTIAWSYDLLTPAEQALFARLAVFADSWTLEAAEAIAGDRDDPDLDVLDGVSSLLDKSLVRPHELAVETEAADPRFGMLQTIHEFAAERLAASRDEGRVRSAHAVWYQQIGCEAEPQLMGPAAASWLDRLDLEHDNLRTALNWFSQQGDEASAVSLAAALWPFWWARGYVTEGRKLIEAALALAPATATATRATALDAAGVLAEIQGDYGQSRAMHEAALTTARASDDQRGVARAMANLGIVTFDEGDLQAAEDLLDESLALARAAGDPSLTATILNDLGLVTSQRGDVVRSEALLQESLVLRRQIGSPVAIARSLNNLGTIALKRGDYTQARRLFDESLERNEEAGDRWGRASVLNNLAETALAEGERAQALALYEESRALFESMGDMRSMATVLVNLAILRRDGLDPDGAAAAYRAALDVYQRLDHRPDVVACLAGLGGIAADRGDVRTAVLLLGAAIGLAEQSQVDLAQIEVPRLQDDIAAVRSTMGEEEFAAAWSRGQALTLEEAIRLATPDVVSGEPQRPDPEGARP